MSFVIERKSNCYPCLCVYRKEKKKYHITVFSRKTKSIIVTNKQKYWVMVEHCKEKAK